MIFDYTAEDVTKCNGLLFEDKTCTFMYAQTTVLKLEKILEQFQKFWNISPYCSPVRFTQNLSKKYKKLFLTFNTFSH